jgi:uncharacterized protein (TIGR00369 family)
MTSSDEEQQQHRERFLEVLVQTRFIRLLGVRIESWSPKGVVLRLPFAEALTNDGKEYHGGAIGSLVDTAGAAAVWAGHDFDKGLRASTVSLTVNYTGRGEGDLVATAHCEKRGRELSFSVIRVEDARGVLVATGSLVYRIVP